MQTCQKFSYFFLIWLPKYAVVQNKKIQFQCINLSQKSHFVWQISWLPKTVQNWFCIQNLRMDISFQEKKAVCKSVTWFKSYNNSSDTGELRRFFKNTQYYQEQTKLAPRKKLQNKICFMVLYAPVWSCLVLYSHVQSFIIWYSPVQSYRVLQGDVQPCMILYGPLQSCIVL